ncbi:uncharacterized protein BJX67DRAFT_379323 [Aspergillus lucknowensis]|uniref:6-phosphogluconate dehydrogenase NADP-binding domain-containing protein n=1 Tax=Aspergillus lucknowensis TaxID=176173 RepID=A0ABR4LXQ2_9EURO
MRDYFYHGFQRLRSPKSHSQRRRLRPIPPGQDLLDCSTVNPETVGSTVAKLKEKQADFLAAPAFGRNPIAVDDKLVFVITGPKRAPDVVKPLNQGVMGRKVIECGEDARKPGLLKIAGNIVTVNLMEAACEANRLRSKCYGRAHRRSICLSPGVTRNGTAPFHHSIKRQMQVTLYNSIATGAYAQPLDTRPGSRVSLAIKDDSHAFAIAKERKTELPGLQVAAEKGIAAREYAGGCLDTSSIYGILRQRAGLWFWKEKSWKG